MSLCSTPRRKSVVFHVLCILYHSSVSHWVKNVDAKTGKPDIYSSWACHCACRVVMCNCIPFLHMYFICNSSACFHPACQLCFKHVFATVTPAWHGNDCSSCVFTWHNILVFSLCYFVASLVCGPLFAAPLAMGACSVCWCTCNCGIHLTFIL